MKTLNIKCAVFFFLLIFVFTGAKVYGSQMSSSEEKSQAHVLFIGSYSEKYRDMKKQTGELAEQLKSIPAELDVTYLEADRFSREENEVSFFRRLKFKIDNSYNYDAVILSGDEALDFTQNYMAQLFKQTPILIFNVNNSEKAAAAEKNLYVSGIHDDYAIYRNISMVLCVSLRLRRTIMPLVRETQKQMSKVLL